jgi:hypothetical protein
MLFLGVIFKIMIMKKTGVFVLSVGFLFTIFATINLLFEEHVTELGKAKIAQVKIHQRIWQPLLGAVIVIAGMGIYKAGKTRGVKVM